MQIALTSFFLPSTAARREVFPAPSRNLPKGALLHVPHPLGAVIECTRGAVWVTHDGDPKDVVLAAGERYTSRSNARLIVQALEDAALSLRA